MALEIHAISTTVSTTVSGGEGHLSAEVDSRAWGFNGGRTQYFAGDDCYVLVYKSANVSQLTSFCSLPPTTFTSQGITDAGYNMVREGIAFSNPIASTSKPMHNPKKLGGNVQNGASDPQYINDSTICRCKSWKITEMRPGAIPPYAFVFIEFNPTVEVFKFGNLTRLSDIFSTPIHGVIFGIANPFTSTFNNFA